MPEPVKLYLDEDSINRALIKALRSRDVDILSAQEADRMGAFDEEHLDFATSLNRTVFTFNTRDFAQLHTLYLAVGRHHAGIIVSDQAQIGVIVRRLLKLLNARSAAEMQDRLEYLSNWR
ncbi:MAG: DUF5615 family PIN-like protein [Anaerolineales bacterium]|nr:DUF5615 family PIN-like protein [Anaerolineales bacterium]